jgi:AMP nucleosidase
MREQDALTQKDLDAIERSNLQQEKATKERMVQDWLPRYTGMQLREFGSYILLVNFAGYVKSFAEKNQVQIAGTDKPMQAATAGNITIINFGIGSPNAGLIIDLLDAAA